MPRALPALTLAELTVELGSRTRAIAALRWLHALPELPQQLPAQLAGVSRRAWEPFAQRCPIVSAVIQERRASPDGTVKLAIALAGAAVEAVLIPAKGRSTVCLSSQAGCTRVCVFCATKDLGFGRHLSAGEMVAQYMLARREAPVERPASNVVFMGMGEPMDNLDEVLRAIEVLTQSPAPQLRAESVTVSTSGVVPQMRRFLAESKASLALSLNATTDEVRTRLMPHNRTWPIGELLGVLREEATRAPRRVTFVEYVLFSGINDSDADADRLVELLRGLPARVNLIPWNPWTGPSTPLGPNGSAAGSRSAASGALEPGPPTSPGLSGAADRSSLAPTARERVLAFHARVARQGQLCLVRWPRGQEIAAACGQLALAGARQASP